MEVTLAKALNIKNRTAGELSRLLGIVSRYNSVREGAKVNFDIKDTFEKYLATSKKLQEIKTTIAKANVAIYGKIYSIAEMKSIISNLRALNTKEGEEQQFVRYGQAEAKPVVYKAFLTDADVEKLVKKLEDDINKFQDEISAFNHTTKVEIPE